MFLPKKYYHQKTSRIRTRLFLEDPNSNGGNDETLKVSEVIQHPKYDPSPMPAQFDFTLLKLSSPVKNLNFFVCLPQGDPTFVRPMFGQTTLRTVTHVTVIM